MSTETAKRSKWFRKLCEDGCQICAVKFPHLPKNGLQFAHIVSTKVGGGNARVNCLALCPNCERSFDIVIKHALYDALKTYTGGKVPENWEHGEGRGRKLRDDDA